MISLPAFEEERRIPALLARLEAGQHLTLCTDAGTPAVSDPGSRLVAAAHRAGITVTVVPGPSAVTAAVSGSGLGGGGGFVFLGFPPRSPGRLRRTSRQRWGWACRWSSSRPPTAWPGPWS